MQVRKLDEWEDHSTVPGGDEVMLLEAVDAPDHVVCLRVSFADLTDEEFNALEDGEVIELR
ncbi:MAG: hypothetical protein AB1671_03235 [Thermodesulfobacteriota bacterium]|jgi:hypothetical protein